MTFVPLTVFVVFVIAILGGPTAFVTIVSNWFYEVAHQVAMWIKYL